MSELKKGLYYYNVEDENADGERVRRKKNNLMIIKTIILLVIMISVLVVALSSGDIILNELGLGRPPAGAVFKNLGTDIDTSYDPLQTSYNGETIIRKFGNEEFSITPVAKYEVSAMVGSMKIYYDDVARLMPVDLALVWGKLAEPEYDKNISYSQSGRWYYTKYKSGIQFNDNFVATHSANTHIIPANDNISKAIKTIKNKEKVSLSGFLVNLEHKDSEGKTTFSKTSLTRTDTDAGSCENLYVTKVRIGNKVYE